eukprot:SAG11_NODE_15_length_26319_cov_13.810564_21_plen_52_part_00
MGVVLSAEIFMVKRYLIPIYHRNNFIGKNTMVKWYHIPITITIRFSADVQD